MGIRLEKITINKIFRLPNGFTVYLIYIVVHFRI